MNNNADNSNINKDAEVALNNVVSTILEDESFCDISLQGTDGVKVPANRTILAVRSNVFRQMLLGEFNESTSRTVKLGYEGEILQAVVEYIHTDTAQILDSKKRKHEESSETTLDRFHPLVLLASAGAYFNLPGLSKKVLSTITQAMNEDPSISFSVLEACRCHGPTIPEALANQSMSVIRRRGRGHVSASNLAGLSASVVEEILEDDKMELTEFDAFKILQLWAEADLTDRKVAAQDLLSRCISLEKIDPQELSTTVTSSGLATSDQLAEAYKVQALAASDIKLGGFRKFRYKYNYLWKKSQSDHPIAAATAEYQMDTLDCPPMTSGIHQWKINLAGAGHNIVHFGMVVAGVADATLNNEFWNQKTGWAVSRHGISRHNGIAGGCGKTLREGRTATLTLKLVVGEKGNGTLTWCVEDGEETIMFSNLLDELNDHPEGFVPAVASSKPSEMRLVSFQRQQD